jgi:hypothetical protein
MSLVVTGLSPDGNIEALKAALTAAGISLDPLQLISASDSHESISRGLAGTGLITSDAGTTVPGLGTGGVRPFFRNESINDRLGDLEIPDTEMDNYAEALERGKSVVGYFAHADSIDKVEEVFKAAGLANVRRF